MRKPKELMFILSIICFFASATAIVAVTFCGDTTDKNAFSYIVPIIFWIGLVAGHVLNIICSNSVKNKINMERPAIISFAENKIAIVVDFLMFIALIVLIYSVYIKIDSESANLVIIAVTYLLVNLHCIFNGRFMRYITEG